MRAEAQEEPAQMSTSGYAYSLNNFVQEDRAGLTSGKKYFVRVRAYKVVEGGIFYSSWSNVGNATVS